MGLTNEKGFAKTLSKSAILLWLNSWLNVMYKEFWIFFLIQMCLTDEKGLTKTLPKSAICLFYDIKLSKYSADYFIVIQLYY